MKRIFIIFVFVTSTFTVMAQTYVPVIKPGTKISYNVASRASGATASINLTMLSFSDTVKIKWDIPYVGSGTFAVTPKAVQSGNKLIAREPQPDEVTLLHDDETLIFLSKDTFNGLQSTKAFMLNGYNFVVKPDTSNYKIDEKPADIIYAVTLKGDRELWILNNPAFPLICRSRRATRALDFYMTAIKND